MTRTPDPLIAALLAQYPSQAAAARAVGVHWTTIARWIKGVRPTPMARRRIQELLAEWGR